ncbi:TRADD-N-associated membrane domain-containing protein [Streptomyces flavalbus]|uniref:Cyanobacterial TRADD-N associated 2 transmembrane domain-containing protein n=1 Tax=Streptomyces flavalbus TaxID=2665155 RepID=A0ABW2WN63_9ACTN
MDPILTGLAASSLASAAGSDAWRAAVDRLRARQRGAGQREQPGQPGDPFQESPVGFPGATDGATPDGSGTAADPTTTVPHQSPAALSDVLEDYYEKVGRRADVSFFAAIAAAVLGYLIIVAGILVGIYRSDDLVLSVVATASGLFSQVLSFFFFRNRAEERRMMIQALADLRQDAERNARATRALELVAQVQQPLLRDNLAAAIALELSGVTPDLKNLHGSLQLFATAPGNGHGNGHPAASGERPV